MSSLPLMWSMALLQLGTGKEAKLLNSGKHGQLKREPIQRSDDFFMNLQLPSCVVDISTSSYISISIVIVQWVVVVYLIHRGWQKSTSMAGWK